MKKFKKTILSSFIALVIILIKTTPAFAKTYQSECIYDTLIGGTQTFTLQHSSGSVISITISEVPCLTRTLENRTYKVSYNSPLAWEAGYNLVIQNNYIKSVNSPYYICYNGQIYSSILKKDSSLQATMSFIYKIGGLNIATGVRTNIVNKELKVSVL